ncbi:hypothetical protein [Pseudomonas tolaasii]|uniref:hypothetical protein n=1 Tax=Pseudomonas tolaasii TaxID=29442 RepID=UPI001C5F7033|nr:hypothetical protein [Pseudomonas tolaasii]MBW4793285.1 hypothetical protein [Pseudomonas tolaasii]
MSFIISKVNVPISPEQELRLKSGIGKAIECVPGKTESLLMLGFEAGYSLYLRGDNRQSMVYITVAVFANPDHHGYEQMSQIIAQLFYNTLGIDPIRIFIKYEDISCWSVADRVFIH